MRLINVATLTLEEFFEVETPPPYAILSHTWEDDEVSFDDFSVNPTSASTRRRKGYNKILKTCQLAVESGLLYAWVDTCCINKSSSSELTEVINSMFQWYRNSAVCYVFLSDLVAEEPSVGSLSACRWFSRGWTLQELIAPREVHFFDRYWCERGTKTDHRVMLSEITGIDTGILHLASSEYSSLGKQLANTAIATKMRWASKRKTTRPEDQAYCMLGIFNVHMPLLYGEGSHAFRRLQEEIAKRSSDLSLFAWQAQAESSPYTRLFASSAAFFSLSLGHIRPFRNEFAITNRGLRVEPEDGLIIFKDEAVNEYFYGWKLLTTGGHNYYVVLLRLGNARFLRTNVVGGGIISKPTSWEPVTAFRHQNCYIELDTIPHPHQVLATRRHFTRFWAPVEFTTPVQVLDAVPQSNWNVMSYNIAQEPTALLLRLVTPRPFTFLIFSSNWIIGLEFYLVEFSIPIVPYILQNVRRLRGFDALKHWGIQSSALDITSNEYAGTGGILVSRLSDGHSDIRVTIERLASLEECARSKRPERLRHSETHQSRLKITIEQLSPVSDVTDSTKEPHELQRDDDGFLRR